ncbi:CLUMA_CG001737, isoform A [Clunio marinus]|uniref:CLUMA_CG001737, isoform A n=1 Tax=Clunio marinus TaxID=568069 RepID=A0A1J1HIT5_9DIPT|nr:CLUMA_CG001737, isoform A [Clunio marinus]
MILLHLPRAISNKKEQNRPSQSVALRTFLGVVRCHKNIYSTPRAMLPPGNFVYYLKFVLFAESSDKSHR